MRTHIILAVFVGFISGHVGAATSSDFCEMVMGRDTLNHALPYTTTPPLEIESDFPLNTFGSVDVIHTLAKVMDATVGEVAVEPIEMIMPEKWRERGVYRVLAARTRGGELSWKGFPPVARGKDHRMLWVAMQEALPDGSFRILGMVSRGLTRTSEWDIPMMMEMQTRLWRELLLIKTDRDPLKMVDLCLWENPQGLPLP